MKMHLLTHSRAALAVVCSIAFVACISTSRAKADEWDKKTILTVNQTIQIRDTVLEPGTYVLRIFDSESDRHIVQIFNADQSHIINTVLAFPKQRMEPTGDTQFVFWETPPETAKALRAWFYPGDTIGTEFPYPEHLKQFAKLTLPAPTPLPAPETAMARPVQPETAAQPEAIEESRDREEVETAESSPPPEPEAAPEKPAELPKTASPYPLIGLCGLFSLGLSGLIRRKPSA
jgi:hypothetical protein